MGGQGLEYWGIGGQGLEYWGARFIILGGQGLEYSGGGGGGNRGQIPSTHMTRGARFRILGGKA